SRFGVSDRLVHPGERELRPARDVLDALVAAVEPALAEAGDLDRVTARLERVVHEGGATRQRAAHERSGHVAGVVDDLIQRTELTWEAHDIDTERA
ncbi:MAG: putative enzyme, partial [Nocardioides sp.]|nr:putative enzyme [Nocardioides sp.]